MDISIKKEKDSTTKATIVIDEGERAKAEAKALTTLAGKVRLKGFRPGKAPEEMVRASVESEQLLEETVRSLLPEALRGALEKSAVKPILEPHIGIQALYPLTLEITFV